ncbi:hypothetical protein RUM43_007171 [Polyplax serrata]|uniref:Uncharacterized protein n=1 Tax=Polyplax serrata TaxID=468196 RepID=A0AAN8PMB0_POLSC
MSQSYPSCEITGGPAGPGRPQKDYSRPLHVDCSVEYELPNAAKPPVGTKSEPLLMIHPCYYRRAESQRRSPFINNLPSRGSGMVGASRRSSRVARLAPPQPPYPVRVVEQAAARAEAVMALLWPEGPPPLYTKPVRPTGKRDPLLCGGDFSSGSDSGISAGHWTDSDRSPLAPELRLQRDFQLGPDSGIATPVSLADDKTALSNRQSIHQQPQPSTQGQAQVQPQPQPQQTQQPVSYQQQQGKSCTPCSCGKSQCMMPSYDSSKPNVITNSENQYLPPYEQTSFQAPGLSQYSQSQLQQWLQTVQMSLSPQRRRVAPAPPQMHRYGIVSPIVIH